MRVKGYYASPLLALCLLPLIGGCVLSGGGETDGRKDAGRGAAANNGPAPAPSALTPEQFEEAKRGVLKLINDRLEYVREQDKAGEQEITGNFKTAALTRYKNLSAGEAHFLAEIGKDVSSLTPPAAAPGAAPRQPQEAQTGDSFLTLTFTKWTAVFAFLLFLIFVGMALLARLLNARTRTVLKAADNTELLVKSINGRLDGLKPDTTLVRSDGGEIPPDVRRWLEGVEGKIDAVCEDAKKFTVKSHDATEAPEPQPQSLTPQLTTPAGGRRAASITPDTFPIQAEEYLNMMAGSTRSVRPDFATNLLLPDAEGKSGWVLVEDKGVEGGLSYVIPRQTYMQAKQDFFVHYNEYYDCERPQRGHVRIIRPAVVTRTEDGWKLDEKGELEMR